MLLQAFGWGVALPAAITAVGHLLFRDPADALSAGRSRFGGALALGGGFLAAFAGFDWAPMQPTDAWHWLPYLALGAVLLDLLALLRPEARWLPILWRLPAAAVAAWLLVPTFSDLETTRPYWQLGLTLGIFALWETLDVLTRSWPGSSYPFALGLVTLAAPPLLLLSGNAKLAQLSGVVPVIVLTTALLAWLKGQPHLTNGLIGGVAVLLPGMVLEGYWNSFSGIPLVSYLFIAAAPLAGLLLVLPPKVARFAVFFVPVAIGLILAVLATSGE